MTTFELPCPVVPLAAASDGLLPVSALDRPLQVDIEIWEHMQTGYYVQLILDGQLVGATRTKTADEFPSDIMTLALAAAHFDHEGIYTLGYRATNDKRLQHTDAPTVQIKVNRTAPGAGLLAPIMFSQLHFGEVVKGLVPGYAYMAAGDTVQTLCNGVMGPAHSVRDDELSTGAIQIGFSRTFLQGLDSAEIDFTYHVTDRAGNQSRVARPVRLAVQTENTPTLI